MNRQSLWFVGLAFAVTGAAFGGCHHGDEETPPGTGGTHVGGSGGATTSTPSGGTGGSAPVYWFPGDPGTPGQPVRLGGGIPFAQGLSKATMVQGLSHTMSAGHCLGDGGAAGSGGTSGSSGGSPVSYCPSSYVPAEPSMDFSAIGQTDLSIVIASQPVFQPVDPTPGCITEGEPISYGSLYLGDCTGITDKIDLLATDSAEFFGENVILPRNTQVVLNGGPVRLISGSAITTAAVGGMVIAASNASSLLLKFEKDLAGVYQRTQIDIGSVGVSALMALPDGKFLFATHRTVTVDSLYAAGFCVDPGSTLVEAEPIHLKTYDPTTGAVSPFADISSEPANVSRVTAQNCSPATVDGNGLPLTCFIGGSANVLAPALDGSILFSDRLAGNVYQIAADGLSMTLLFSAPQGTLLLSGMTQAPNGVIYVIRSATSDFNCGGILSYPAIMYWDDIVTHQLVDWKVLDDPEYDAILPAVCNTGVVERNCPIDRNFLGGGLFVNITDDSQGNLVVTTTVSGVTQAIPVIPTP